MSQNQAEICELYYWQSLQGRGEFVRLILEDTATPYIDVCRQPEAEGGGISHIMAFRNGEKAGHPIFAPPILKVGDVIINQTPNICRFLGERLGLVPNEEAARLYANQIMLTINDLLVAVHDTHHPVATNLYYEEQKEAALERAYHFHQERLPKLISYFEKVLAYNEGYTLVGKETSYVDLMMFQMLVGLNYAFPKSFQKVSPDIPRLLQLRDAVAQRPRIKAYLQSPRRIPFNENGIFRHYPELDLKD
ncbi:Glutathione S-transferase, C-terminal domain [Xenococcus sp. PCC 7305]|uniref:glutathione S-transferase n=1 Tax=Xenococcus sp. PCC 7305 TaxID=102125 RepID=UPI0002AC7CAC|nr:glutathione S-transferase [Xenococcus sp. PCC 7305]ELS04116.1 Glutathione S-transferase, C-terminal domain [Xenococcus sp. PCC 7305]